jgi:hypothetical protein
MWRAHQVMQSRTIRTDGSMGKIHSFCAMYSLRMSAWMVPESLWGSKPRRSASAAYMASRIQADGLMVIDTEIASRSIPSKSASMSASVSTATPSRPTSPALMGYDSDNPMSVGMSKSTERPVCPWASR